MELSHLESGPGVKDMVVMKVVSIAVTGIDEVVNISVSPARSRRCPLSHTYLGLE